jgi:hypothetical protein
MAESLLQQTVVGLFKSHKNSNFNYKPLKPFAMKQPILLLALFSILAFTSCTTAYKTGQTPDDVYYSPARPEDEYVEVNRRDDRRYQSDEEYYDDRYLRMKVRNRHRWSDLDEWYYFNKRYSYGYNPYAWNNPWSPNVYWNCNHNPYYYGGGVVIKPNSPTIYSKPRVFNLNTYSTPPSNTKVTRNTYSSPRINSNSNSDRNTGNILRNIFNGNNNNSSSNSNNNSSSSPTKTSSSSSSSSGSSGGSAPVRRF